jgi:hypothetical protein
MLNLPPMGMSVNSSSGVVSKKSSFKKSSSAAGGGISSSSAARVVAGLLSGISVSAKIPESSVGTDEGATDGDKVCATEGVLVDGKVGE